MIALLLTICYPVFAPVFDYLEREHRMKSYMEYMESINKENMVYDILKTFRQIESSNNYHARGLSGEYGAYQFTRASWEDWCVKTIGYILDIRDPEHQDIIAEQKVRCLLYYNGYTLDQIASFWNCGSPEYKGKIGKNKNGIKYNVPGYVRKFIIQYERP